MHFKHFPTVIHGNYSLSLPYPPYCRSSNGRHVRLPLALSTCLGSTSRRGKRCYSMHIGCTHRGHPRRRENDHSIISRVLIAIKEQTHTPSPHLLITDKITLLSVFVTKIHVTIFKLCAHAY